MYFEIQKVIIFITFCEKSNKKCKAQGIESYLNSKLSNLLRLGFTQNVF